MVHERLTRLSAVFIMLALLFLLGPRQAFAAPPVRVALMPAGGSGIEQEIIDHIATKLEGDAQVVLSTVNPDWYVLCKIHEINDQVSGQIRYNGTVTIKTQDGQVVSTVAVQKYNQDFSLQPGAPLNKRLVDSAAQEVITAISDRVVAQLKEAVETELSTRDKIIKAQSFADDDKYDLAIENLATIGPETVHFQAVQKRIAQFKMEKQSMELVESAEAKAKAGHYAQAIALLRQVDIQSKRHAKAIQLESRYKALAAHRSRKLVTTSNAHTTNVSATGTKLKLDDALEQEKQALVKRQKEIEQAQAALKKQRAAQ